MQIIDIGRGQFGIYSTNGRRGPYDTLLIFKGTLDECLSWRRQQN